MSEATFIPLFATRKRMAAFSPLSLTPSLWLKADVGTFQTSGGSAAAVDTDPVGEWQDQSGNGRHLGATLTTRPLLKLNIQNGLPVLRFDGTNDLLKTAVFDPVLSQPFTIVLAAKLIAWVDGRYWHDGFNVDSPVLFNTDTDGVGMFAGAAGPNINAVAGNFGIYVAKFSGAGSTFQLDGGTPETGNTSTGGCDGVTLGSRADGSLSSNIDVGEYFLFSGALSAGNETSLRTYLNTRWAAF
jgi:hypothetical protein